MYAASKNYKHWPGIIKNLDTIDDDVSPLSDKKRYVLKCVTKIKCEGEADILGQRWVITDCELQIKLEDSYKNKLHQKLSELAVYCKNGKALYN